MANVNRGMQLVAVFAVMVLPALVLAQGRQVQSLDGTWQIVFDPQNEGSQQQWTNDQNFPLDRQRDIVVPGCWELEEQDYEGVAFYRHTFQVPACWKGKVVRLHFGAVNFRTEVWLNGTAVGQHEGGFTPFEFRVDDLLTFDQPNTLILRSCRSDPAARQTS